MDPNAYASFQPQQPYPVNGQVISSASVSPGDHALAAAGNPPMITSPVFSQAIPSAIPMSATMSGRQDTNPANLSVAAADAAAAIIAQQQQQQQQQQQVNRLANNVTHQLWQSSLHALGLSGRDPNSLSLDEKHKLVAHVKKAQLQHSQNQALAANVALNNPRAQ
jgi:hypothetical protein